MPVLVHLEEPGVLYTECTESAKAQALPQDLWSNQ